MSIRYFVRHEFDDRDEALDFAKAIPDVYDGYVLTKEGNFWVLRIGSVEKLESQL